MLDLITLIVVLAVIGFALWLVVTYIPMPDPMKKVIIVVVVLIILLYVVRLLLGGGGLRLAP